jgi:hypothetical protein
MRWDVSDAGARMDCQVAVHLHSLAPPASTFERSPQQELAQVAPPFVAALHEQSGSDWAAKIIAAPNMVVSCSGRRRMVAIGR